MVIDRKDILRARDELRLSALEAAKIAGVDTGQWLRYETGRLPVPQNHQGIMRLMYWWAACKAAIKKQ